MDVIDLGAGDNDTPPPDAVRRGACTRRSSSRRSASTASSRGCRRSGRRSSRWVERRFGIRFDPATETLPLHRLQGGARRTCPLAVVNPGDVVLVPEPGYQAYIGGAILSGAVAAHLPARGRSSDFLLELDDVPADVLAAAEAGLRQLSQQPDRGGRDHGVPRARRWRICRKHGILLAYDNAYCELDVRRLSGAEHLRDPGRAARSPSSSSRSPRASR